MRQVGTIANSTDARRFADYLLTLAIATRVEERPDGWAVWARNEDQVERARRELEEFIRNPADPRYQDAAEAAETLRQQAARGEREFRKNSIDLRGRWDRPVLARCPLTMGLIAFSILVAGASRLGAKPEPVLNSLMIASTTRNGDWVEWHGLEDIRHGELWRLVTPIFIHFGPLHLLFNMFCLYDLGGLIEIRRGTWRLALLVLVTAIPSNLAQYFMSGPVFGGMSGVVYGLLGYAWMKSRYDPGVGIFLHPNTVVIMIAWLVLCMTGLIGSIANTAHLVGLGVGVLIGYAPAGWRTWVRR